MKRSMPNSSAVDKLRMRRCSSDSIQGSCSGRCCCHGLGNAVQPEGPLEECFKAIDKARDR